MHLISFDFETEFLDLQHREKTAFFWSADVLSGRHIVRVTFCHGFLIDVLSGRHFVSTYFVRHFVRKTFCQFSFFVVGFCIDVLSGRQIVSILTIFLVC